MGTARANRQIMSQQKPMFPLHGVGRRKSSVARVWVKPGKGSIVVNGRPYEHYFSVDAARRLIPVPAKVTGRSDQFDITVSVDGGGVVGIVAHVGSTTSRLQDESVSLIFL